MTKMLFHAPWGVAALLRGDTEKISLLEKIGGWKCLQWRDITQSFAMLLFIARSNMGNAGTWDFMESFGRLRPKNRYTQLSWWVHEDLLVQKSRFVSTKVKVILWPLNQDSYGMTISYKFKATGPIVTNFYEEPPAGAEETKIVQTLQVTWPT